jgi:hypothetical protein
MSLQFADRVETTVASGYSSGGGSLVVAYDDNLPIVGDFWIVVEAEGANTEECFKVTANDGGSPSTLTVVGAQYNTVASDHASSAVVKGSIMGAAAYDQLRADLVLRGTIASLPAAGNEGRLFRPSDAPYELYDTGAAWIYSLNGHEVTPPDLTDFTDDSSTATVAQANGSIRITGSNNQYARYYRGAPGSTPWFMSVIIRGAIGPEDFGHWVIGVGETHANNRKVVFGVEHNAASFTQTPHLYVNWANGDWSFNANKASEPFDIVSPGGGFVLAIRDTGTNLVFLMGDDPTGALADYQIIYQESRTAFLTTPNRTVFEILSSTNYPPVARIHHWAQAVE